VPGTTELVADPVSLRERYLPAPAGSLFAIEAGEGDLVVLLHGVTANAYIWEPVMAQLARGHHVVALDQRGHGRSSAPAGGSYDGAAYAGDVVSAIESLSGGAAVIVGHSLGARNAVVAGTLSPDLISGVVAVDFVPYVETGVYDRLDERVAAGDQAFHNFEHVRTYLSQRYPGLPADAVARRADHGYVRRADADVRALADAAAMVATCAGLREDLAPYLASLDVPALLVRGADSTFVTAEAFEAAQRLRPDLLAAVVPGADHYVPEERPGALADLVEAFLGGLHGTWTGGGKEDL
jgi:2-(acetamidomethylene)succinate hydrolase